MYFSPRLVARDGDEELDDFDYDDEHVEMESEIGEYRVDDDEDLDDMADSKFGTPAPAMMGTPAPEEMAFGTPAPVAPKKPAKKATAAKKVAAKKPAPPV